MLHCETDIQTDRQYKCIYDIAYDHNVLRYEDQLSKGIQIEFSLTGQNTSLKFQCAMFDPLCNFLSDKFSYQFFCSARA